MENVLLIVHLIIATVLIGAVLLQRSEGGGLGMSSDSNFMSNRSASSALNRLTWVIASAFLATSLILTILAANQAGKESVLDTNDINQIEADTNELNTSSDQLKALPKTEEPSLPPKEY